MAALCEGTPIEAVARMFKIGTNTITRVIRETGEAFADYMDANFRDLPCLRIEMDEQWQYVGAHGSRLMNPEKERGDFWLWAAIDADTKLVLSHRVGKRSWIDGNLFVRDVREHVSKDVTADQLVAMRIHGADPEFVKGIDAQLGRNLGVDELVAFRIHGVSPDFVGQMHELVAKDLSADDLVAFRIHGVSPEFVKEMKNEGYSEISTDQLVAMRIHGVNAAYVKELREHGYKNLSIDDLIEMRIHGYPHRASM